MAGEWEFGTPFSDRLLGETHAWGKCQCKPGIMDMLVGLGLMIGEANGVPEHAVKAKLIPIMAEAEHKPPHFIEMLLKRPQFLSECRSFKSPRRLPRFSTAFYTSYAERSHGKGGRICSVDS